MAITTKKRCFPSWKAASLFPGTEAAKAAPVHSKLSREHLLKRLTQKPYVSTRKKLFPRGRVFEDPAIPYTAAELHGLLCGGLEPVFGSSSKQHIETFGAIANANQARFSAKF